MNAGQANSREISTYIAGWEIGPWSSDRMRITNQTLMDNPGGTLLKAVGLEDDLRRIVRIMTASSY